MSNPVTPSISKIELLDGEPEVKTHPSERHHIDRNKKECFILSLDGGGMRGIISTAVLNGFSRILKKLDYEKPLTEVFDMIVGTSTGGLIATALTCPSMIGRTREQGPGLASLAEMQNIYLLYGKEIFSEEVHGIFKAVSDKYSEKQFEQLLKLWYGETRFSECVIPTLVMAYNATAGLPFPMASTESQNLYSWEVCRGTSAAPTYFPPLRLGNHLIIDGGVIANNPSLYAYRYARSLWPNCQKIHILSISTCSAVYRYPRMNSHGISSWASVYKVYGTAQHQTTDEMMQCLPDVDYVRVYKELDDSIEMDDTREETLISLIDSGNLLFKRFSTQMTEFAQRLIDARTHKEEDIQQIIDEKPIQRKVSFLQRLKNWIKR